MARNTHLHGYELLMAPYAIAHLKISIKLYETGYRFGSDERARVYLTNALEPAQDFTGRFNFAIPALAHEAEAVNSIKRQRRFTVLIGNPPYSLYSANLSDDARRLVESYRFVQGRRIKERGALQLEKNLQDDYVKFFAFAESQLSESTTGVLSFISNSGYLGNRSLRGMREQLYRHFQWIHIVDLRGSVSRARRDAPKDENVFDIVQGVSICLLAATGHKKASKNVGYIEVKGLRSSKYSWLLDHAILAVEWKALAPAPEEYFFLPFESDLREEYRRWPSIDEIMPINSSGMVTARDAITIWFEGAALRRFAERFAAVTPEVARTEFDIGPDTKDWSVQRAQEDLRSRDLGTSTARVLYRPFDWRFTFYSGHARGFLCNPRRPVLQHMAGGDNVALIVNRQVNNDFRHALVSRALIDTCTLSSATRETAYAFPLFISGVGSDPAMSLFSAQMRPNISREYLERVDELAGLRDVDDKKRKPAILALNFVYGILYSSTYRSRYAEFLRLDFPRIPLPGNSQLFRDVCELGGELIALHLLESPKVDRSTTEYLGGRGPDVEKISWSNNTVWIDKPQTVGFKGVREDVWNFHIGGYQVCGKWLKDRKGRTLSKDDIAHYQKIIVALSETIRLMQEIDEVIEKHGGWPRAFQTGGPEAAPAKVIPFRLRTVDPKPAERYVTCVPLVPLKAAAGAFSDPQHIEDDGFAWVAVESRHRLRKGMFVAQVVGKSMEPAIPDGAYCLFRSPVEGTRLGKTVLVHLRDAKDPETGQRYTVKRYESEKAAKGDSWRHERITLKPLNPEFQPIVLTGQDEGELQVIAEFLEVLTDGTAASD